MAEGGKKGSPERQRLTWPALAVAFWMLVISSLAADERRGFEDGDDARDGRFKHEPTPVDVECRYRCKRQSSASSCPLWCRQRSLLATAIAASSSASSSSSSSKRIRGHSKRHVDMDDVRTSTEDEASSMAAATGSSQSALRVSVVVKTAKRNTLEAVVVWLLRPDATDDVTSPFVFVLHWARDTCNLDERFPHCDDPDTYYSKNIRSRTAAQNNFTVTNLTYNSKYWVRVEHERLKSPKVTFTTPGCSTPVDKTFKRCLAAPAVAQTTTAPGEDVSLRVNVTCLHFDLEAPIVRAGLRWRLHDDGSNSTTWESTILIRHLTPGGVHMEVLRTTNYEMAITLKPDKLYEITVKASTENRDIIYHSLNLNTTRHQYNNETPSANAQEGCFTTTITTPDKLKSTTTHEGQFHPLILAIAALAVVAMTTIALLCINRCREVQSKLLKKTILSKSNSYKTTPGTPRLPKEEQLQMILKTDDWELDARDVTLGTEVGQGAFGLVMTGYYQNVQVAIKVLKGDVLPSYREELLREIALMKRIGKHPNIVSLIGACTIRDPIALIMEYMPFGNLQAFLQKCRVEGGLRRKDTGAEVEYCPLDELNGTKEFWVLTSTDMLSFARQVAVAMEFLTDRKYVHRDLAARNVLVGQNKVVKLCDFGLARLVYNGDQYCKLTNGRLPLKWMALESIRDRVFTAQSDVWSYGVLLWEIATLGCSPYPNIALVDLYRLLTEGYRMEQPKNCSAELYDIMSQCWHENPSNRPTFGEIRTQLDNMLTQRRNYLDLDCRDPSNGGVIVRPRSPTDATAAAYTSSTIDLFVTDDPTLPQTHQLDRTGKGNNNDDSTGSEDPWDFSSKEQRWNSEEEEFGYLRSSEIITSIESKKSKQEEEDVCVHLL